MLLMLRMSIIKVLIIKYSVFNFFIPNFDTEYVKYFNFCSSVFKTMNINYCKFL